MHDDLVGCIQCDAVYEKQSIAQGDAFVCERCHCVLQTNKPDSINRSFIISLSGLILIYPALFLPLIGLYAVGLTNQTSLMQSINVLLNSEFYIIAASVFFFTLAIPVARLLSCFYICFSIKYLAIKKHHLNFFRTYHILDSFAMLHVFFLGLMVSMYKLLAMAELTLNIGLFAYIFLLICSTLISVTLDQQAIWEKLESSVDH